MLLILKLSLQIVVIIETDREEGINVKTYTTFTPNIAFTSTLIRPNCRPYS